MPYMRSLRFVSLMLGVGILCSGCMLVHDTAQTMVVEPAEFPPHLDQVALCAHANRLAERAWNELNVDSQKHPDDYRKGFINGYADYLQFGGTGEPPPLPPRCYWCKETPEGRQRSLDWFAGFRHGASSARQSGVRELILVPAAGTGAHGESGNAVCHGPIGTTAMPELFVPPAPKQEESKIPPPPKLNPMP
jgi:hypothetical protein